MKWATRASVMVAMALVGAKTVAWLTSSSVAMLGSLADSTLDLMASVVTLFAVRTALIPADDDHRFGHGKAEALAGLFQAAIMSGSAVFLGLESASSLYDPKPVTASALVMQISLLAIVLSLGLVMFQSYVVRRTGSLAIAGDHLHYKGDLLMNSAVIAAAYASGLGWLYADGIFGVLIAGYILYGALDIARPAVDMLMDKELPDADREAIFNMVMGSPGVIGMHKLKTRQSGRDTFIQMHLEVDGTLSVKEGHMITVEVEATVGEAYPDAEIMTHVETASERTANLTIKEILGKKDD